jgi:hypothetical protein
VIPYLVCQLSWKINQNPSISLILKDHGSTFKFLVWAQINRYGITQKYKNLSKFGCPGRRVKITKIPLWIYIDIMDTSTGYYHIISSLALFSLYRSSMTRVLTLPGDPYIVVYLNYPYIDFILVSSYGLGRSPLPLIFSLLLVASCPTFRVDLLA